MTGKQAIEYIHSFSWLGSKPGLSRTAELLKRMGDPQKKLQFVHIAGTNGKGSTAAMLHSVLRAAGYNAGLYTSPYISSFNERIQTDAPITDDELGRATERAAACAEAMEDHPTEFELVTAVAMQHFSDSRCDIVVLEAGLGGRLDSTNVIDAPLAAVITNIGFDHMRELGDTLEQIASEKAGIIKQGCDVVLYPQRENVRDAIARACLARSARLHDVPAEVNITRRGLDGQVADIAGLKDVQLSLLGDYQPLNAAAVVIAVRLLEGKGFKIGEEALRAGLKSAKWPGRFEVLGASPVFIVDGAHNAQGAAALGMSLRAYLPGEKLTFIMGVMRDKEYLKIIEGLLPLAERFLTVTPNNPRALPAKELAQAIAQAGGKAQALGSVAAAVDAALCAGADAICALGSLYMAGDVRSAYFFAKMRDSAPRDIV